MRKPRFIRCPCGDRRDSPRNPEEWVGVKHDFMAEHKECRHALDRDHHRFKSQNPVKTNPYMKFIYEVTHE